MGKTITAQKRLEERWFPQTKTFDDDIYGAREEDIQELEQRSLKLLSNLIRQGILRNRTNDVCPNVHNQAYQMAKGKFIDLTCTKQGEEVLEHLFSDDQAEEQYWEDERILLGAITALQSLCIMGTQVGVKGTPEQLKRMVAHLETTPDPLDVNVWDSVKRLKYEVDQTAGTQYLSLVNKKRTPKGAFDVLVSVGAWERHENLPLIEKWISNSLYAQRTRGSHSWPR